MLRQVKISAAVNTLNLLETKWHLELNVGSCIGIMSQLLVVVEAILLIAQAQSLMPLETILFPNLKPFKFLTRTYEELHLHLLKLTHAEHKLPCNNLVAEGLTYLCDTKWQTHASSLLHIQEVNEDSLSSLGTQIHIHSVVAATSHLGLEHKVELAHVGPVACATNWINNLIIEDDLLEFFEIIIVHRLLKATVKFIPLSLVSKHARIGLTEHCLVEALAKALLCLCYLFVHLLLNLG